MTKYIEEKEIYTIEDKKYNVISVSNVDENLESIYDVLVRYVLQKTEEKN